MPTCEACPTCHRAFSTPRVERLTSNLADALRQIAHQTDVAPFTAKALGIRGQGLHPECEKRSIVNARIGPS